MHTSAALPTKERLHRHEQNQPCRKTCADLGKDHHSFSSYRPCSIGQFNKSARADASAYPPHDQRLSVDFFFAFSASNIHRQRSSAQVRA